MPVSKKLVQSDLYVLNGREFNMLIAFRAVTMIQLLTLVTRKWRIFV